MVTTGVVGSVAGRSGDSRSSPCESEQIGQAELSERGVLGDGAYAVIDKDTGKVASAKSVKLFPELLGSCKPLSLSVRRGNLR